MYKALTLSALVTLMPLNIQASAADANDSLAARADSIPSKEMNQSKELATYLNSMGLLEPLQHAGSVENIQDPIMLRKITEAIYNFNLKDQKPQDQELPLDQENLFQVPENISTMSLKNLKILAIQKKPESKHANFWLGELAANPGVTKTKKLEAQKWWYNAALQGHKGAIERLISSKKPRYLVLLPGNQNAYKLFRQRNAALFAAAKSDEGKENANRGEALFSIGNLYKEGDKDLLTQGDRAIKYWSLSAKEGYKEAIEKIYSLNVAVIEDKHAIL